MDCIGPPLLVFTGIRMAFLRYGWMEGVIAEDYWLEGKKFYTREFWWRISWSQYLGRELGNVVESKVYNRIGDGMI
ncbi:hypothetical protein EYC80_008164 [Monilinia laxa]|uniref:Uncharacterized protein n=1 Tax=Monilinia laxa TaxID=61186 RepID=A0A5N6JTN8_MONLA|nr:hypothetical protein EYC80_008164 [Monilinia laxa]